MAAALLGDGHVVWHLATSAEAVDRGLAMHFSVSVIGIVLLTQENRYCHWNASSIRDPRPRRSLQGAMLHGHRRDEKRRGHVPPTTGLRGAGVRPMKVLR